MATEWRLDMQHSSINIMVRHLLVAKVRGRFARWTGAASSIDTSEAQRDAHLRSPDF
jgi:polyisoprenoid-binding protein YceI